MVSVVSGSQPGEAPTDKLTRSILLTITGSLIVGLLFFFALSGEITEKRLIVIIIFVPFYIILLVLLGLLS